MAITIETTRTVGVTTFVSWATAGAAFVKLPDGTVVANTGATGSVTITNQDGTANSGFERRDQPTSWSGNFNHGAKLLWTGTRQTGGVSPGPTEIVFSSPVVGAGVQIQADFFGTFLAHLDVYVGADVTSFTRAGYSTAGDDNTAIYLGCLSTIAEITKLVYWVTDTSGLDFAIDQLDLVLTATRSGAWAYCGDSMLMGAA